MSLGGYLKCNIYKGSYQAFYIGLLDSFTGNSLGNCQHFPAIRYSQKSRMERSERTTSFTFYGFLLSWLSSDWSWKKHPRPHFSHS